MSIAEKIMLEGDEERYASEQRLNNYKLSMSQISRMFSDSKKRRRMEKAQTCSEINELKLEVEALRKAVGASSSTSAQTTPAAEATPPAPTDQPPKTATKSTSSTGKPPKTKPVTTPSQRRSDRKNKVAVPDTEEIMSDVTNIFKNT